MAICRSLARLVGFVLLGLVALPCSHAQEVGLSSQTHRVDNLARQLEATQAALDKARTELSELRGLPESADSQVELQHLPTVDDANAFKNADSEQLVSYCQPTNGNCPRCNPEKRFTWTPFGAVYGEMLASDNTFSLRGAPLFLVPGPAPGIDDSRFTVSGQQSLLGLNVSGPSLGSFQSGGNIAANFFGEQPIANNPGLFFLLAWAELKNDQWRFWIGQDADGIGRQNTNSPSWTSHKMQGNFGQLRPGFRMERYFQGTELVDSSLYFGLTQQAVNDFIAVPGVAGIDNGWPNVEFRWQTTIGAERGGRRALLLALGGLIGETRAVDDLAASDINVSTSWAVIPELHMEAERFGFQGEAFVGQAIGTYNGAIGQSLNPEDGEAIYSTGGFGEVFWKATPYLTASIGYGIDDPRDRDLGMVTASLGQRARNESYWVNFIWKLSEDWESRFEVSHLETDYVAPSNSSNSMIYHFLLRYGF